MGKPGFPTPPRTRAGGPRTQAPAPGRVWEGYALPRRTFFIPSVCGAAAWTADVNTVRRVLPPSQPPPAGGRSRTPSPSGGGLGRGSSPCPRRRDAGGTPALPGRLHRALCAPRMGPDVTMGEPGSPIPPPAVRVWAGYALAQGNGETGFPRPLTPREGVGGRSPCAGEWGNRVSPSPHPAGGCGRATPLRRGMGKPGFPVPSPHGRVWAGYALAQGDGETGFPHPPTPQGVWAGYALPGTTWFYPVRVRRSRLAVSGARTARRPGRPRPRRWRSARCPRCPRGLRSAR